MYFFSKWKIPLISLAALIGLLVMSPIIINHVDLNQFRSFIENKVTEYTGRQLKINGDLKLNLSLHPYLKVEQVAFSNSSWSDRPEMITAELLELKVDLMPLFYGQLVFEELLLQGVTILLEKNSEGQANWELGESGRAEELSAINDTEQKSFDFSLAPVFRYVSFDKVSVQYSDVREKIETVVDIEALNLSNHVINEPFSFNANGLINGRPFDVLGEAGLQQGSDLHAEDEPLVVKVNANVLGIFLTAAGEIKQPIINGGIDIDISLTSKDLNNSFVLATGQSLNQYSVKTNHAIPLQLSLNLSNLEGDYEFRNINLKLADSDLKGEASLVLNVERPKLSARLSSKKINLDRVLKKNRSSNEVGAKAVSKISEATLDFSWLNKIDADIRYDVRQVVVEEFFPEKFLINLSLNSGQLKVDKFDFDIGKAIFRSQIFIDGRQRKSVVEAKAEIKEFDLLLLDKYLNMSVLQQGKLNADINVVGAGEEVKELLMSLSGASRVRLKNLYFSHAFDRKKHDFHIETLGLDFAEMNAPVTFSLNGEVDKKEVVMSGELLTMASLINNSDTDLLVKANAFEINISSEIFSAEPVSLDSIQVDVSLSMRSLENSFGLISKIFPEVKFDHDIPSLPTSVNAELNISRNSVTAKNIELLIGDNDVQGEATIDTSKNKMYISLDLASEVVDINSLYPSVDKRKLEKNKSLKSDKLFSAEPLPSLEFLDDFDADVRYQLAKLTANNESIKNISLNMKVNDGVMRVKPLKLDFEKGTIDTKLILSDDNEWHFQLSSEIRRLDYDRLMAFLAVGEFARGDLDADIDLQSAGDSVSDLMADLGGQVRITTEGGSIDTGAMRLLSRDISSLIPFTDKSDRQKIRCAVAQFNINDGLAKTHALVLDTGIVSALGSGEINLATEEINLYVAPRTKRTSVIKLALVPLDVRGPLVSPSITPNVAGSTISTTNTAVHIGLAVATGGITLLAEDLTNKLWEQFIDDTDYCALALAGEKVVPTLTRIKADERAFDEEKRDDAYIEELDDDEF